MERMEEGLSPQRQREIIDRGVAIEAATKEELEQALVKVEGLLKSDGEDPIIKELVEELKKKIEQKGPETIH